MSARLRRLVARLWPDSLSGRLMMILFSGLVAAHALAFVLIVLDRIAVAHETGDYFMIRDFADSVAILDYIKPEERPAWLDRLSRHDFRFHLKEAEVFEPPVPRAEMVLERLRAAMGAGHDVNLAYINPPKRWPWGWLIHLKDGSPLAIENLPPPAPTSPWLPVALAVQLCLLAFFTWVAVKFATRPLARLEHAAKSLGSDLRADPLPEDGPKEVARTATAFNAMQRRIAEQVSERIQILAAISHDLQTPITRMRLRADFLGDNGAKEKLQDDLQEMQTLVEQGLALARGKDDIDPEATAHVSVEASREPS